MSDAWEEAGFKPVAATPADDPWAAAGFKPVEQPRAAPPAGELQPEDMTPYNVPNAFVDRVAAGFKNIPHDTSEFFKEGLQQMTGPGQDFGYVGARIERQLREAGASDQEAKSEADRLTQRMETNAQVVGRAFGAVQAVTSPLLGAFRSLVSRPIEEATGFAKEGTELIAMTAAAVKGMNAPHTVARVKVAGGRVEVTPIGSLPTAEDFRTGGSLIGGEAEANLKRAWQEDGVHPAEAVHDAQRDAFVKNDLQTAQFVAYHGSPYDFNRFDLSKIGTGEGAQSYGHGFYFAENPQVAGEYKTSLTVKQLEKYHQQLRETGSAERPAPPEGAMYQVRINADKEHFLDWDKRLNQQTPEIQAKLQQAMTPEQWKEFQSADAGTAVRRGFIAPDEETVSQKLQEAGIPGIKYLDQGSRPKADVEARAATERVIAEIQAEIDKGGHTPAEIAKMRETQDGMRKLEADVTRNIVVFDPDLIEITHKNDTIFKLTRDEEAALTAGEGRPAALGAEVTTDPPLDVPLSTQPASPPGALAAAYHSASDKLFDIGRDLQMKLAPMATGSVESMATVKDFANTVRRNRWDWSRIDNDIVTSKPLKSARDRLGESAAQQRERMWNAADEESVLRQEGKANENMGLTTLEPEERAVVEDLHTRAQAAWLRARDLGMVEGEGLPAYTPRMVINMGLATDGERALPLNGIGSNLKVKTAQMRRRQYLTAEETEAAAKGAMGEGAEIARDIRTLPLATAKLEDAIAGRTLIENIKDVGKRTGSETVTEGGIPAGSEQKWFTIDHPAFRTWRPKFKEKEGGGVEAVKDAEGNEVFEQVPIYVRGDFEGPLRAVLSHKSGPLYGAVMSLKGKTMSMIMNSPLIHNAVEWGRALPAMPGKVATFKVYFEGNAAKHGVPFDGTLRYMYDHLFGTAPRPTTASPTMLEAIDAGLVPIGKRFFNQDITGIMEAPDLAPGRSMTAKLLGAVPGLFDEAAGAAVKRSIDKAGNFWHNTLLWDRVADLQMGLYTNFRDNLLAKGVDNQTAARAAAHWANRYAGALPQEAMSDAARKVSNVLMFSRSFTLGNLGVMKDMLTGLPKDVLAQIERDAGFREGSIAAAGEGAPGAAATEAVQFAKSMARRKAIGIVVADMALMYLGNSLLQNAMNIMLNDSTLDKEMHGYAQRMAEALTKRVENPLSLLQPLDFMESVSATSDNEPGRKDRVKIGTAKDGTAIYARNPAGKIGEEFIGYLSGPFDMMRRKLGTIARPGWQILANDAGFGRKVYDPDADSPAKYAKNAGLIAGHLVKSQFPEGQINAFADLVKGEGDPKVAALQSFGPVAGVTFAKGAPGGPAVGEMYHARAQHDYAVQAALPDIRRQIQRGDVAGAQGRMTELGIPAGLQKFYVRTSLNPSTRLSGRTLKDFYLYATPEQRQRLDRSMGPQP